SEIKQVNTALLESFNGQAISVEIHKIQDKQNYKVEIDEMWSFIGKKAEQRWLWYAIEKDSKKILAYVLGKRDDDAFLELKNY
ncbi:MAG: transposase, partial [Blastocatellia bacterium]|nr:transposase [Blastocatellia bacterium]